MVGESGIFYSEGGGFWSAPEGASGVLVDVSGETVFFFLDGLAFLIWYLYTALLCSFNVLENLWAPLFMETKYR